MNSIKLKLTCCTVALFSQLPASASAQTNVTVYGLINASLDHAWTSRATAGTPTAVPSQVNPSTYNGQNTSVNRMTSNASRLGFRGTEDLGDGLQTVWQLEAAANVDTGTGAFFSRNSGLGLAGNFGRVIAGIWDTPYKSLTIPFGGFESTTAADGQLIGNPGFGVPATAGTASPAGSTLDASFDRRQANSVQYWSPVLHGFSTNLAVAFGETPGRSNLGILSGSATYENGPLTLQYGHEQHSDYFGLAQLGGAALGANNGSSKDTGDKLVAKYVYQNTTFKGVVERLAYKNSDTVSDHINQYHRDAFALVLEQRMGAGKLWMSYGMASAGVCERTGGAACVTSGLNAKSAGIGYLYELSKRTSIYSFYDTVINGASGRYALAVPVGSNEPGSRSQIVSFGFVNRF